ncbi:hypothetical protein LTR17_005107 [Elasticomyces elasticus]|nr:hypothetical protein LTR17_005107 [Elasticomyces elasticus]
MQQSGEVEKCDVVATHTEYNVEDKVVGKQHVAGSALLTFNSLAIISSLGSVLGVFFGMYAPSGRGPGQISMLLTLPSLCIGLGNFILLPVALAFGRRPVFIVSIIILLAAIIGAALQNSYDAHLGTRVLAGLATGATESVLPLILTEITFLADRGRIMGLYWGSQNLLTAVLSIAASHEVAGLGWRWYYWVFAITIGAGLVFVLLGAFETSFQRPLANIDGQVVVTNEFGITQVMPDDQAQDYLDSSNARGGFDDDWDAAEVLWSEPCALVDTSSSSSAPDLENMATDGHQFDVASTTLCCFDHLRRLIRRDIPIFDVRHDPHWCRLVSKGSWTHQCLAPVLLLGFSMHILFGFSSHSA